MSLLLWLLVLLFTDVALVGFRIGAVVLAAFITDDVVLAAFETAAVQ